MYTLCTPHVHPMCTPCTPKVCKIAKSKVKPDPMFGRRNKVGYGLITTRKITPYEKFYTVLETDVDVQIVARQQHHSFQCFSYGASTNQVICPLGEAGYEQQVLNKPEDKPLLFFIQHDSVGNCEVRFVTQHAPIHMHHMYTLTHLTIST